MKSRIYRIDCQFGETPIVCFLRECNTQDGVFFWRGTGYHARPTSLRRLVAILRKWGLVATPYVDGWVVELG